MRYPKHRKPWTPSEIDALAYHWGTSSLDALARRFGRTPRAIKEQAKSQGLGPPSRGRMSLLEASKRSGYDRGTIQLVAQRLGIRLPRSPATLKHSGKRPRQHNRHHAIDEETLQLITDELARYPDAGRYQSSPQGEWGTGSKPPECVECGSADRPHYAKGVCRRCYSRLQAARRRCEVTGLGTGTATADPDSGGLGADTGPGSGNPRATAHRNS